MSPAVVLPAARPRRRPVIRAGPGLVERLIVAGVLFINFFGTPADWFTVNTGSASGPDSNPLLIAGTFLGVAVLTIGLVGNSEAVLKVLSVEPLLVVFLGFIAMSYVWSSDPGATLIEVIKLLVLSLFAVILLVRFTLDEIIAITVAVLAAGLVLDLVWVFGLPTYGRSSSAWDGLATQKNALGSRAVVGVVLAALLARRRPWMRFRLYGALALAGVLLVGSQSKTSLAACALTLMAATVYLSFRAKSTLYGAVVITLISSSVAAALFATANIGLLAEWLDKDVTLTGRTLMWPIVIDSIMDRPWLGYGFGGYWGGYLSPSHDVWVAAPWAPTHAHNAALQIALDIGIIGAVVFALINVRALARATKHIQVVPGATSLFPLVFLTLALMMSITESGVVQQRAGWVLFMVAVVHARSPARLEPPQRSNGQGLPMIDSYADSMSSNRVPLSSPRGSGTGAASTSATAAVQAGTSPTGR